MQSTHEFLLKTNRTGSVSLNTQTETAPITEMVVQPPRNSSSIHTEPNTAFYNTPYNQPWIELFHSHPSWSVCQISYRKDDNPWVPFGKFRLIDASDIKLGFRAFRIKATSLEFRLCNETGQTIDSIIGRNYKISSPGRYVVESGSGCRRVSDAQIADCLRTIRPKHRFVELTFESDAIWQKAYLSYVIEGQKDSAWRKASMKLRCQLPGYWFARVEAPKGITCAFNNSAGEWDNNADRNYQIRMPGKYLIASSSLIYCGPSDLDVHMA